MQQSPEKLVFANNSVSRTLFIWLWATCFMTPAYHHKSKEQTVPSFSSTDYEVMQSLISTLRPVEECVRALCRQNCSLYDSHLAVEVALDDLSLQKSKLAKDLKKQIIECISQRLSSPYFIQVFLEDKNLLGHWNHFTPPTQKSIRKTSCFWCVFWNAILRQLWRRNSNQSQWHHKVHPPAMRASTTGLRRKGEKEHRLAARWSRPLTVSWRPTTNLDSLDRTCSKPSTQLGHCAQLRAAASGPSVLPDTSVIDSDLDSETTL